MAVAVAGESSSGYRLRHVANKWRRHRIAHERRLERIDLMELDKNSDPPAEVLAGDTSLDDQLAQITHLDQKRRDRKRRSEPFPWELGLPYALAIAGFAYPFLLVPFFVLLGWLENPPGGVALWMVGVMLAGAPISGLFTAFVGFLLSTLLWLAAGVVVKSLRTELDNVRLAAHVGGWTALLGTTMYLGMMDVLQERSGPWLVVAWIAGPGLATPIAQYVAAWSQWPRESHLVLFPRPRFGLYQILVATAWIAGLLTLLKLMGWLNLWARYYVGVWLVYQWLTLHLALGVCRWRHRRRFQGRGGDAEGMTR